MKDVKGFEGLYYFDNEFCIWSYKRCETNSIGIKKLIGGKKLNITYRNGYASVTLKDKSKYKYFYVHRLLASTFLDNFTHNSEVNHLDGNKTNNNLNNLEVCTHKENMQHSTNVLLEGNQKLVYQYDLKGNFLKEWQNSFEVGRVLKIIPTNISKCCLGKRKYAGDYQWSYSKKDRLNTIQKANNLSKLVEKYDIDNNFINTYPSLGAVCEVHGFKKNMFSYYLNKNKNKLIEYGQYKWKFKNTY